MATSRPLKWLQFVGAGFLAAFGLKNILKKYFPKDIWEERRLSTQVSIKRFWQLLIVVPIIISFVVFIEVKLNSSPLPSKEIEVTQLTQKPSEGVEQCSNLFSISGLYCLLVNSKLLPLFETFAIATALSLYISDGGGRREQAIRENWMLIDGARGSETSGARYSAIEELYKEKVNLRGLDAPNSDLNNINLAGANLVGANLSGAQLRNTNFFGTYLNEANLRDACLQKSDLRSAQLHAADLRGANLKSAQLQDSLLGAVKFHRAILYTSDLSGADLRGARFYETSIQGAIFNRVNLTGATFEDVDFTGTYLVNCILKRTKFKKCQGLEISNIDQSSDWHLAEFDELTLPDMPELSRINVDYFQGSSQGHSAKLSRLLSQLREIENIIDAISHGKYSSMNLEEIRSKIQTEGLYVNDFQKISDLLWQLEDLSQKKKKELTDYLEKAKQKIRKI